MEPGDSSEVWTNHDREILPSCVGLVKTTKNIMKKLTLSLELNGEGTTDENIAELDETMEIVKRISPALDDFVISTYPPLRKNRLETEVGSTKDQSQLSLKGSKIYQIFGL